MFHFVPPYNNWFNISTESLYLLFFHFGTLNHWIALVSHFSESKSVKTNSQNRCTRCILNLSQYADPFPLTLIIPVNNHKTFYLNISIVVIMYMWSESQYVYLLIYSPSCHLKYSIYLFIYFDHQRILCREWVFKHMIKTSQ